MPIYCITGTNRGLGLEFVRQLAKDESNTILALARSIRSDLSDLKTATAPSSTVHILECDTGNPDSILSFATAAKDLLSSSKIDYLINNAGVSLGSSQSSLDFDPALLEEMMRVNAVGPGLVVQRLLEAGLLASDVRVINLSSGLGSIAETLGDSVRKFCGYSMSKAALNMLSVHQAGDLRRKAGLEGAVVIAMDPGWVQTRMGGHGAILTPGESIGGMLRVIRGLGDGDNGASYEYSGKRKPW